MAGSDSKKVSLSPEEKELLLCDKNIDYSQSVKAARINNFLSKSSKKQDDSLTEYEQALIQEAALQRELLKLQATQALFDTITDSLGAQQYIKLAKTADRGKSLNRLSKDNAYRIVILIFLALFFDFIQFVAGIVAIVPVVGVIAYPIVAFIVRIIKFLVFFFIWKHYEVSFFDRFLVSFSLKKASKDPKVILFVFIKYVVGVLNFILGLVLPFYPDILIETLFVILLVRTIDASRVKDKELEHIQARIKQIKALKEIKMRFS